MTELPKAYFKTIKDKKDNKIEFYQDVLQITVRANAILISLDSTNPSEISYIDSLDQIQDPEKSVNSGFMLSSSKYDIWQDKKSV